MKKLLGAIALGMSLFANVAYAEIDANYVDVQLRRYDRWPIIATCTGSDVNFRSDANTNSEVLTMLQKDDLLLIKNIKKGGEYTWAECRFVDRVNQKYYDGYIATQYLDLVINAVNFERRFEGAFRRDRVFNVDKFRESVPWAPVGAITEAKPETFSYATHKMQVGPYWFHGEANTDGFHTIGVILPEPGYRIANLEVGLPFAEPNFRVLDSNMRAMGWRCSLDKPFSQMSEFYWYKDEKVDGSMRPVEGFTITAKDGKISTIQYYTIPVD